MRTTHRCTRSKQLASQRLHQAAATSPNAHSVDGSALLEGTLPSSATALCSCQRLLDPHLDIGSSVQSIYPVSIWQHHEVAAL